MYIVGNEITITWVLGPTDSPLLSSDYDILFLPSTLAGSYTDDGIMNYVAPTESTAGSLTYAFTPVATGKFTVRLATGTAAAHTVLDDKHFWVFEFLPVIINSDKVLAASQRPGVKLLKNDTTSWDLSWYSMSGITQDPVDPNKLWYCGVHTGGDTYASVASLDMTTGAETLYEEVVQPAGILNNNMQQVAASPDGRLVIIQVGSQSNIYNAYYSDAPYTTWTVCTYNGFTTAFGGQANIFWDVKKECFWWMNSIELYVSLDGINWYEQEWDPLANDTNNSAMSSAGWIERCDFGNFDILSVGGPPTGGGSERVLMYNGTANMTSPPPDDWEDYNGVNDIFGAGYGSQKSIAIISALDENSAWMITQNGIMIESNDGATFDSGSIVDESSKFATLLQYAGCFVGFGKYFAVRNNAGVAQWFESTNMSTWAVSTDTRVTAYNPAFAASNNMQKWLRFRDNSGYAWVETNGSFDYGITAVT